MDDAADHPPIIDPRLAARVGRQMRRNLRKLGVGQPETVGNHWRFLSEAVNHDRAPMPTFLWVRALMSNEMREALQQRGIAGGIAAC